LQLQGRICGAVKVTCYAKVGHRLLHGTAGLSKRVQYYSWYVSEHCMSLLVCAKRGIVTGQYDNCWHGNLQAVDFVYVTSDELSNLLLKPVSTGSPYTLNVSYQPLYNHRQHCGRCNIVLYFATIVGSASWRMALSCLTRCCWFYATYPNILRRTCISCNTGIIEEKFVTSKWNAEGGSQVEHNNHLCRSQM
jgi:hypothetical protein